MHHAVMCGQSVHAFRCALSLISLVFGEVFFAGSASLHDWFLHFLESAFSVTCFVYYMNTGPLADFSSHSQTRQLLNSYNTQLHDGNNARYIYMIDCSRMNITHIPSCVCTECQ